MRKTIFVFLSAAILFLSPLSRAGEFSKEDTLSLFDDSKHLPEEFLSIVEAIHRYKSTYTKKEIIDLISTAYYILKMEGIEISVYQVAEGIEKFSEDEIGIDLKTLARAYIKAQLSKSAKK